MGPLFEELARSATHEGVLTLRRRRLPSLDSDVFEIKLDDEYLMSSLFTVAEIELARLALAELPGTDLDVAVGGLGLGCTARAMLEDDRVRTLTVVEALAPVVAWHEQALLPDSEALTSDTRTRFVHGDFFALVEHAGGLDPDHPDRRFHAIAVDIDHTPRHVLHPSHAPFYRPDGLRGLVRHLHPGGVFALWSDDPPDGEFLATLGEVFVASEAHVVSFPNVLTGGESANTVYTAHI